MKLQPSEAELDEIVCRVRKLRWIGMDSEAMALQALIREAEVADCVLAEPLETD